jgi:hypothetical protein
VVCLDGLVLLCALRRPGLDQTHFANATRGSIRLKLLKIGALVQFSVRRIKVGMASACPAADVWGQATRRLAAAASRRSRGIIPRPTEIASSLRRQRQMIPALLAPIGATRKHASNITNKAIGISAQSRIGTVRFMS